MPLRWLLHPTLPSISFRWESCVNQQRGEDLCTIMNGKYVVLFLNSFSGLAFAGQILSKLVHSDTDYGHPMKA